jgi:hypothetical protein
MNALLLPEVLLRQARPSQTDLPLATEGVLRYVWGSRWGEMLVEVVDGEVFVNGQRVEPTAAPITSSDIPGVPK